MSNCHFNVHVFVRVCSILFINRKVTYFFLYELSTFFAHLSTGVNGFFLLIYLYDIFAYSGINPGSVILVANLFSLFKASFQIGAGS